MCALVNDEIPSLVFPLYSLVGTGYQPIPEVFSQHQMMYPEIGVRKQPFNRNLSISSTSLFVTHLLVTCLLALMAASTVMAHDDSLPHQGNPPLHAQDIMRAFAAEHHHNERLPSQAVTSCVGGFAGSYPCSNVDLMAFLPLAQIGGGNGNDIWGWLRPHTGKHRRDCRDLRRQIHAFESARRKWTRLSHRPAKRSDDPRLANPDGRSPIVDTSLMKLSRALSYP